jgi:hypothetical protein
MRPLFDSPASFQEHQDYPDEDDLFDGLLDGPASPPSFDCIIHHHPKGLACRECALAFYETWDQVAAQQKGKHQPIPAEEAQTNDSNTGLKQGCIL